MKKINVIGKEIAIVQDNKEDFISITDIAKYKNPDAPADIVKNWLRSKNTIELLGLWEKLHNSDFKLVEFDQFKSDAGSNHFVLSPKKWINSTNAIGLQSKSGRHGGTYAHKDIAFEFASWISIEFKLYLIKEFQRLKEDEIKQIDSDSFMKCKVIFSPSTMLTEHRMNGVINTIRKKALKTPSIHRISLPVSGETKRPSHRGNLSLPPIRQADDYQLLV